MPSSSLPEQLNQTGRMQTRRTPATARRSPAELGLRILILPPGIGRAVGGRHPALDVAGRDGKAAA